MNKLIAIALCYMFFDGFGQNKTLIKNVSIVSVEDGSIQAKQDVLIENGIIKKIAPRQKNNAVIIDGTGKFLMPSMADMHAHLNNNGISTKHFFNLQLAAGVTTLRSMRGDYSHLAIRDSIKNGTLIAPKLYLAAPPINRFLKIPIDSIAPLVQQYKRDGFDFLKILNIGSQNYYDAFKKAADEVGMHLVGHLPNTGLSYAIEQKQRSIEHLQGYPDYYLQDLQQDLQTQIQATVQAGIYNCPTLDYTFVGSSSQYYKLTDLKKRNGMPYIPEAVKNQWEKILTEYLAEVKPEEINKDSLQLVAMQATMKLMKANNCKLLLSPDPSSIFQVPGFGMVEEMKLFRTIGFSNQEILKMVTHTPAEYFGEAERWGLVKIGYEANLLLLDANPLENIENVSQVEAVFLNGKHLSKTYLHEQLKQGLK